MTGFTQTETAFMTAMASRFGLQDATGLDITPEQILLTDFGTAT